MAWKMSGLFNTMELGLDDLLSPGIPNLLESSGSWLLESNFSHFRNLPSDGKEDINTTHMDGVDAQPNNLTSSVHDKVNEGYLINQVFDQPMLPVNELNFDLDVDSPNFVTYPVLSPLSLPETSSLSSSNAFERLLLVNDLDVIVVPKEDLGMAFGSSCIVVAEDNDADRRVSNGLSNASLNILNDIMPVDANSTPASLISTDSKGSTKPFFPDHSYSQQPSDISNSSLDDPKSENFNSSMDEFIKAADLPGIKGKVHVDVSLKKPALEMLNLDAINLTLIEELLAGMGQVMDAEVGSLVANDMNITNILKTNEESDTSNKTEDTMEEFLDEYDDEMNESRKKYLERRRKNNIASRRSREIKKIKYSEMEKKAIALELENKKLKEKIAKMELLSTQMKQTLIARLKKV